MALTERQEEDKIEIAGVYKHIQVRTATVIERDGVEISRSFHRHVVTADDDASGQSADVRALAAQLHTPARQSAYRAFKASQS